MVKCPNCGIELNKPMMNPRVHYTTPCNVYFNCPKCNFDFYKYKIKKERMKRTILLKRMDLFPDFKGVCDNCGKEIKKDFKIKCPECGKYYCKEHITKEKHICDKESYQKKLKEMKRIKKKYKGMII